MIAPTNIQGSLLSASCNFLEQTITPSTALNVAIYSACVYKTSCEAITAIIVGYTSLIDTNTASFISRAILPLGLLQLTPRQPSYPAQIPYELPCQS